MARNKCTFKKIQKITILTAALEKNLITVTSFSSLCNIYGAARCKVQKKKIVLSFILFHHIYCSKPISDKRYQIKLKQERRKSIDL